MKSWKKLISQTMKALARQDGQDLVEYALLVALIAFSATSGVKSLATKINNAFTAIGTNVSSQV